MRILEAADAMGATPAADCLALLLPEAAASLILALTTATIGLLGATAMAGTVGGGESGSGYYLWLSALRRFRHPHYRPGADCYCPAYSDAGDPPGSPAASRLIALPRRVDLASVRRPRRRRWLPAQYCRG